jgi:hypothetical protein
MRRAIFGGLALLIIGALAWASGDPWKAKPYQQWDDKDIKKILNDSPWSKVIQVAAPWKGMGAAGEPEQGGLSAGQAQPVTGGGGMYGGSASSPPSPTGGAAQIPLAPFVVRWVSARTFRAAALRGEVLAGHVKEEDMEKQFAQPVESYQVLVVGPDMEPFEGADENALKAKTYLTPKKSKLKISPARVEIQRASDGQAPQVIIFFFSKKSANGEATIAADEKSVEFSCSAGKANIKATFDLSKMEDKEGRDL